MEWTRQKLAHYIGRTRLVVEFEGISEEGLARALNCEAMGRLEKIEIIINNDEQSDEEKVAEIARLVSQ